MSLDAGGHLTHGFRPNISGKMFDQSSYGTDPATGLLDYDAVRARAQGVQAADPHRRLLRLPAPGQLREDARDRRRGGRHARSSTWRTSPAWSPARCSPATSTRCRTRTSSPAPPTSRCAARAAGSCSASRSSPTRSTAAARWCSAARCRTSWPPRPSPSPRPAGPTFAGYAQARRRQRAAPRRGALPARRDAWSPAAPTTTWCCIDVTSFGLTGRQAESALLDAGIVTNRNAVPADPNGAWYTSGIRIGTPALTTPRLRRGRVRPGRRADHRRARPPRRRPPTRDGSPSKAKYAMDEGLADKTRAAAAELLAAHPLYPGLDLS